MLKLSIEMLLYQSMNAHAACRSRVVVIYGAKPTKAAEVAQRESRSGAEESRRTYTPSPHAQWPRSQSTHSDSRAWRRKRASDNFCASHSTACWSRWERCQTDFAESDLSSYCCIICESPNANSLVTMHQMATRPIQKLLSFEAIARDSLILVIAVLLFVAILCRTIIYITCILAGLRLNQLIGRKGGRSLHQCPGFASRRSLVFRFDWRELHVPC
jgi:hypothetical protein